MQRRATMAMRIALALILGLSLLPLAPAFGGDAQPTFKLDLQIAQVGAGQPPPVAGGGAMAPSLKESIALALKNNLDITIEGFNPRLRDQDLGLVEAAAFHQIECFEAARLFANTEGIIPAPETSHAIRGAINEALRCKETGEAKCILFNLSGHGICDLGSYDRFLNGELEDYAYPQHAIEKALAELPAVD